MKKILIMGLPGSGKTTFAKSLTDKLAEQKISFAWYNADHVRKMYDDWDFSLEGRLRQAQRMTAKAQIVKDLGIVAVCDFVCPTEYLREVFNADIMVHMDTLEQGRFDDTNHIFEPPHNYTYKVIDFNQNDCVIEQIIKQLT